MLRLPPLTDNNTRLDVPPELFKALLVANRAGKTEFTIAFTDQLAPSFSSTWRPGQGCALPEPVRYSSIGNAIRQILALVQPAAVEHPLITMAPNSGDKSETTGEQTSTTWLSILGEIGIGEERPWKIPPHPVPRTDKYAQLARADAIVKTESTEEYANLLVTVNPQTLFLAEEMLRVLDPKMLSLMMGAGHGNWLLVIPKGWREQFPGPYPPSVELHHGVRAIAGAVSQWWLPDTFPTNTAPGESCNYPAEHLKRTTGLALVKENEAATGNAVDVLADLRPPWNRLKHQVMAVPDVHKDLSNDGRCLAVVVGEKDAGKYGVILSNGITPICPDN